MPWSHEKQMAYQREYRKLHRETLNAARRSKHLDNPEAQRAYQRNWRSVNPGLVKRQLARANASRKSRYPEQRERIQKRLREFRAANPQKVAAYQRKAYEKNRPKLLAYVKKYVKENPHVPALANAKRRAAKMGASLGDVSLIVQWEKSIRAMNWVRCHWCGTKVSGKKVQFDHVVPLSNQGPHSIGNLCASCAECNQRKNARLIAGWVVKDQSFLNLT